MAELRAVLSPDLPSLPDESRIMLPRPELVFADGHRPLAACAEEGYPPSAPGLPDGRPVEERYWLEAVCCA